MGNDPQSAQHRPTKRELVFQLLRDAGSRGVLTEEFLQAGCGSRFGARVQELRDDGIAVGVECVRSGSYRYTLLPDGRLFELPPSLNAALHDWGGGM